MRKNVVLWIVAFVITIILVIYQRKTGPTYPVNTKVEMDGTTYKNELIRSFGGEGDAKVELNIPDQKVVAYLVYKKYPTNDEYQRVEFVRNGDNLTAFLPHQLPAGKLQYEVYLTKGAKEYALREKPIVIRFKGSVPAWALVPHILLMFVAMLIGNRAGLEAVFRRKNTYNLTLIVLISLFFGGLIFGPIVQNYAFGSYWSGWPLGHDLTDNKTIFVFIAWLIAFFMLRKNKLHKLWVITAAVFMILVYSIPHSAMGSELNHETEKIETGN